MWYHIKKQRGIMSNSCYNRRETLNYKNKHLQESFGGYNNGWEQSNFHYEILIQGKTKQGEHLKKKMSNILKVLVVTRNNLSIVISQVFLSSTYWTCNSTLRG